MPGILSLPEYLVYPVYLEYYWCNSVLVYCFTDLLDNWFTTGVLLVLDVNCANTVNL